MANGEILTATHSRQLRLHPTLSHTAKQAFLFPDLTTGSLISIGKLCDDDCVATFKKHSVTISKNKKTIITGPRLANGLWHLPLTTIPSPQTTPQTHEINAILRLDKTKTELAQYFHAACFSPSTSTFLSAINQGFFTSWPGLTAKLIQKHLPPSIATAKGHLDQEQQNLQSTTKQTQHEHFIAASTIEWDTLSKSYSDLTGRFPIQSYQGNSYIFLLYHNKSNAILVEPLKNRSANELTRAFHKTLTILGNHGCSTDIHIMDNECPGTVKDFLRDHNITIQLVPPHIHRRNAAERAIRTFKNHFIAGLASCDPAFPLRAWDLLLPQAQLTLNLLRASNSNPSLSAYHFLFGAFDYPKTPIAPPGTRVVIHEKPLQRASFAPHGIEGWYVGPAMDHYRCYTCLVSSTNRIRVSDTVKFFPHSVPFPQTTLETYLRQVAEDMLHILQNPTEQPYPTLTFGNTLKNAFIQVSQILKRATIQPSPVTPVPDATPLPTPIVRDPVPPPRVPDDHMPPLTVPDQPGPSPRVKPMTFTSATKKQIMPAYHRTLGRLPRLLRHHYDLRPRPFLAQAITDITSRPDPLTVDATLSLDRLLRSPHAQQWNNGLSNEIGRLAQGVGKTRSAEKKIQGSNTIVFIKKHQVPKGKSITYANFVCAYRPLKDDPFRVRMTVGGDKLPYPDDPSSPSASLLDTKIMLNSVISDADRGARFMTADVKNFYLDTQMPYYQYMRIHRKYFTPEICAEYDIDALCEADGYVYVEIRKGMYGLKEAAILAYKQLIRNLLPYGYRPIPLSPGLWKHDTNPLYFILTVDDFGIKHYRKEHVDHLLTALRNHYTISTDWTGAHYCGLTLDWHYDKRYVDVSMPNYIPNVLHKLQHPPPNKPQHAPHPWTKPVFGAQVQFAPKDDTSPPLSTKDATFIQSVTGSLLYYARAVDPTILPALNEIATKQSKPTTTTMSKTKHLLDYIATHPLAILRYYASDMTLHIDSDSAYLVLPQARSRAAGYHYLSSKYPPTTHEPPHNAPVLVECRTIRHVMASAAEAETTTAFLNAQAAIPIRATLNALGHTQPPTPMKVDNSTANGILNSNIRRKNPRHLICGTTGFATASNNNSLTFIGAQATRIKLTTSPNTIPRAIIKPFDHSISVFLHHRTCEGVFLPSGHKPRAMMSHTI